MPDDEIVMTQADLDAVIDRALDRSEQRRKAAEQKAADEAAKNPPQPVALQPQRKRLGRMSYQEK